MLRFKRAFYLISCALLLALMIGCAGSRQKRDAVQMRSERVQTALGDITQALQKYQDVHGYFPKGMATLRDTQYLSIMPDVEQEWTLKYYTDGGRVMMVEAISTSSMPDGEGYEIIYRVTEGLWEGYGITIFP